MSYVASLRDHTWFIQSGAEPGGVTLGGGRSDAVDRFRTMRWLPAQGTDTITVSRVKEDGTTEIVWESQAGGSTAPQESRLDLRLTRGFNVTTSFAAKAYLYESLDGQAR